MDIEVYENDDEYYEQYLHTDEADYQYPVDLYHNKSQLFILCGSPHFINNPCADFQDTICIINQYQRHEIPPDAKWARNDTYYDDMERKLLFGKYRKYFLTRYENTLRVDTYFGKPIPKITPYRGAIFYDRIHDRLNVVLKY